MKYFNTKYGRKAVFKLKEKRKELEWKLSIKRKWSYAKFRSISERRDLFLGSQFSFLIKFRSNSLGMIKRKASSFTFYNENVNC